MAIIKYGINEGYEYWDGVNLPEILMARGNEWLIKNNKIHQSYTVTALDLSIIGLEFDDFNVGNSHPIKNPLLGIDDTLRIHQKVIDINSSQNSQLMIADKFLTLSDIQIEKDRILTQNTETIGRIESNYVVNQTIIEQSNRFASLINQTFDAIISQVSATYLTKTEQEEFIREVNTRFTQTSEEFLFQFNFLSQMITDVEGVVNTNQNELIKYIRFVDGNIILGVLGNELLLQLQNDRLSFFQNNREVAYFSNNKLFITDGEFLVSLTIGNFAFLPRRSGNLSFKKVK